LYFARDITWGSNCKDRSQLLVGFSIQFVMAWGTWKWLIRLRIWFSRTQDERLGQCSTWMKEPRNPPIR
jgi:hypothetical protein